MLDTACVRRPAGYEGLCAMPQVAIGHNGPEEEDDGRTVYVTWSIDGENGTSLLAHATQEEEEGDEEGREECPPTPPPFDGNGYARRLRQDAESVVSPETFEEICGMLRGDEAGAAMGAPPLLRGEDMQNYVIQRVGEDCAGLVMQLAFRVVFAEGRS